MRRALVAALALLGIVAAGCADIPPDPLRIEHGILTVNNTTSGDWTNVEIWINQYFRATVPEIAAGGQFRVPLDAFVSGYAQRFDVRHALIKDLRLSAKQPDGTPVAITLRTGLAALGGQR